MCFTVKSTVFLYMTPHSLVEVYRRLGGTYYLDLQGRRVIAVRRVLCFLLGGLGLPLGSEDGDSTS
jgi:hypothetical protein